MGNWGVPVENGLQCLKRTGTKPHLIFNSRTSSPDHTSDRPACPPGFSLGVPINQDRGAFLIGVSCASIATEPRSAAK